MRKDNIETNVLIWMNTFSKNEKQHFFQENNFNVEFIRDEFFWKTLWYTDLCQTKTMCEKAEIVLNEMKQNLMICYGIYLENPNKILFKGKSFRKKIDFTLKTIGTNHYVMIESPAFIENEYYEITNVMHFYHIIAKYTHEGVLNKSIEDFKMKKVEFQEILQHKNFIKK